MENIEKPKNTPAVEQPNFNDIQLKMAMMQLEFKHKELELKERELDLRDKELDILDAHNKNRAEVDVEIAKIYNKKTA